MFASNELVTANVIPDRYLQTGLGPAIFGRVGRVVADPPYTVGKIKSPVVGWVDVDFRDPESKDSPHEIYRVERAWLSHWPIRGGAS